MLCRESNAERQALQERCQLFGPHRACTVVLQGEILIIYYKGITFFTLLSKLHYCNLEIRNVQHNMLFIPFQGADSKYGITYGTSAKHLNLFHQSSTTEFTTESISKHRQQSVHLYLEQSKIKSYCIAPNFGM